MKILFMNPQGNFDNDDRYWTEHPDFGGQLVYVKEVALALSELGHSVDIVTRQFNDEHMTGFSARIDHYEGYDYVRIIRIPAGPDTFIEKEKLWPYLDEWVQNIVAFYQDEKTDIDFITTHYGDGGYAGALLSHALKVPFSFTGHSLGAQKMDKLNIQPSSVVAMQKRYAFADRLMGERIAIENAAIIFTSTAQEKDEQYAHTSYQDVSQNKKEAFMIAPPGVNEKVFGMNVRNKVEEETSHTIAQTLKNHIAPENIDKPYIILASRLDQKKNHSGLLKAYALDKSLQEKANIAISLRGVEDAYISYANLKGEEKVLMDELMSLIEDYQLKGKVTFINILSQAALAACYRYFSKRNSIFSLTSTYEPFGLAPIEAMCAGLPAAVTQYGGPADVLYEDGRKFGVLLDVNDLDHVAKGLHEIIDHHAEYQKQGLYRVETSYTWKATAKKYIEAIQKVKLNPQTASLKLPTEKPAHLNAEAVFKNHYFKR